MQITDTDIRSNLSYKIGFIGGSKAGTAFAGYLIKSGVKVQGFYSYNFNSAIASAYITRTRAYDNLQALVIDSDILFVSVKDAYIHNIWQKIQYFDLNNKIIYHLSGFLSSSVFDNFDGRCLGAASVHIPVAFTNKDTVPRKLKTAPFVVEGSNIAIHAITQIASQTKNAIIRIKPTAKDKYHAACVLSSSLILALLKSASNLVEQAFEVSSQVQASENLVSNLAISALENVNINNNLIAAATGPIVRNDIAMVAKHLEVLQNSEHQALYKMLSNILLDNVNVEAKHAFKNILKYS